jgi:hypothetical protein
MFTLTQLAAAVRRGSESGVSGVQGMVGWRPEGVPKPIKNYVYYPALENNFYHNVQDPLKSLSYFDFYVEFYAGTLDVDSVQRIIYTANASTGDYVEVFYISINANGETCLHRYNGSSSIPTIIYNFGVQKKCKFKITEIDGLINIFNVDNDGVEIFIYKSSRYVDVNKYCFLNVSYNTQPYFITDFYKVDKNTGEKIQINFDDNDPHFNWINYIEPDTFEYNPYTQQWESQTTTLTIPEKIDLFTSNGDIANKPSIYTFSTTHALGQYFKVSNADLSGDFSFIVYNTDLKPYTTIFKAHSDVNEHDYLYLMIEYDGLLRFYCNQHVTDTSLRSCRLEVAYIDPADQVRKKYYYKKGDNIEIKKEAGLIYVFVNNEQMIFEYQIDQGQTYTQYDYINIAACNPDTSSASGPIDCSGAFTNTSILKFDDYFVQWSVFFDKIEFEQLGNTYTTYFGRTGELNKYDQLGNLIIEAVNMTPEDVIEFKNIPYTNVYENVDKKEFIKIDIE